jgi:hypothetical protein
MADSLLSSAGFISPKISDNLLSSKSYPLVSDYYQRDTYVEELGDSFEVSFVLLVGLPDQEYWDVGTPAHFLAEIDLQFELWLFFDFSGNVGSSSL